MNLAREPRLRIRSRCSKSPAMAKLSSKRPTDVELGAAGEAGGVGEHHAAPEPLAALAAPATLAGVRDPPSGEMPVHVPVVDVVRGVVLGDLRRDPRHHVGPGVPVVRAEEADPVAGDVVERLVPGVEHPGVRARLPVGDPRAVAAQDVERPVGGPAVHHDDLDLGVRLADDAVERPPQPGLAVEDRHHDRDPRRPDGIGRLGLGRGSIGGRARHPVPFPVRQRVRARPRRLAAGPIVPVAGGLRGRLGRGVVACYARPDG